MSSARAHGCASILLLVLASTSCRITDNPAANTNTSPETAVVSTTPPFQTREPDRYQATRTITISTPNGKTIVTKTLIARDGPLRREESDDVVYLELTEGRFVLLPRQQVYAAVTAEELLPTDDDDANFPDRLLHTDPISTTYQPLGTENIGGRTAKKYRIVVNNPTGENVSNSETMMWIDETLTMPVKSETKSADGTRTSMELSDVVLTPDKQLFQIPSNFEKIAFRELWKQLKSAGVNP